MDCQTVRKFLDHDDLEQSRKHFTDALQAHLITCRACREYQTVHAQIYKSFQRYGLLPMPPRVKKLVIQKLEKKQGGRTVSVFDAKLVAVVASVLFLGASLWWFWPTWDKKEFVEAVQLSQATQDQEQSSVPANKEPLKRDLTKFTESALSKVIETEDNLWEVQFGSQTFGGVSPRARSKSFFEPLSHTPQLHPSEVSAAKQHLGRLERGYSRSPASPARRSQSSPSRSLLQPVEHQAARAQREPISSPQRVVAGEQAVSHAKKHSGEPVQTPHQPMPVSEPTPFSPCPESPYHLSEEPHQLAQNYGLEPGKDPIQQKKLSDRQKTGRKLAGMGTEEQTQHMLDELAGNQSQEPQPQQDAYTVLGETGDFDYTGYRFDSCEEIEI